MIGPAIRLANTAGTAIPANGTASKLDAIPTGATLPKASAVIGAVASVAPAETARSLIGPDRLLPIRVRAEAVPQTAATDSHAPTDRTAPGSNVRTTSDATARTADEGGRR